MIRQDQHYRLTRYLRSPIIDAGEGETVSPKAVRVKLDQVLWFKERHLKTICFDEINEKQIVALFPLLVDGGVLIAVHITDDAFKALKSKFRYQVFHDAPFVIVKRLSGSSGEQPAPKPKPVNGRKRVLLVRYGAFGDHLMVTPIIQHYFDEGWHITYNCTEKGEDLFKHDPRIDDLWVQESDIVLGTRDALGVYWKAIGKDYDKFVNLSEVVEGDLLRVEGTDHYTDTWERRHADCNKNYLDHHFTRAGLDITGRLPVIPLSDQEREWAQAEVEKVRRKLGKSFIVLWNIFGSSWHKAYPWMFDVWMILITNRDDIGIISVSDVLGKYVVGSEFDGLVYNGCDKYKIRQSLALHSAVDAVVTPETWSMTAALAFPAPMIALLSHSSTVNVTQREGDYLLHPKVKDCSCYPCHQLHYSKISCPRGAFNKDATLCMDSIVPADVYDALIEIRSRHEYNASTA